MFSLAVAAVVALSSPVVSPAAAGDTVTYRIDVSHSRLVFKIRHFVSKGEAVSTVERNHHH